VVASASVWVPNRLPRAPSPAPLGDHPIRSIAILLACWAVFAALILPTPKILDSREGPTFRVAAIQTNVPQDNRVAQSFEERLRDFEEFCRLTRDAAKAEPRPDLIVWPEGMFPGFALNGEAVQVERGAVLHYPDGSATTVFYDRLIELQKEIGVPMLVGASAAEGLKITAGDGGRVEVTQEALFNSAFMVRGGVVEEARYDKMRLMPFGEVMPYISKWDWLEERLLALGGRGLTFDWEAGTRTVVFEIDKRNGDPARSAGPPVRVAAPICFEAMYAGQMRRLANGEGQPADVLVNMSNDGWFAWFDGGRENLVLQCRWRALELRRPILRAVNTGISVAIDSDGRVVRRLGPRRAGVLIAEFDVSPGPGTISGRMRDVVGWLCLGGMILLTAGAVWRRSKSDGKGARG
jgi:apolipoprotein N-acyltransferase